MSEWLTVLAPAFYPSRDRVRYFLQSAARHGIQPQLYGIGQPFTGWGESHVSLLLPELAKVTTPMVLFTDAADVLFNGPPEEIRDAWIEMGAPLEVVVGIEEDGGLNAGGFLAPTSVMRDAVEVIDGMPGGDPQERWRDAVQSGRLNVVHDPRRRKI